MQFIFPVLLSLLPWTVDSKSNGTDEAVIQCFVCSPENPECMSLASYKARYKFLEPCITGCAVLVEKTGKMGIYDPNITIVRGCDGMATCEEDNVLCCKCDFDGCNIDNYCNSGYIFQFKLRIVIFVLAAVHSL